MRGKQSNNMEQNVGLTGNKQDQDVSMDVESCLEEGGGGLNRQNLKFTHFKIVR
jgi:hypothetical protein